MVVASTEVKCDIKRIGIKKCARESGFTRIFIRKLLRGLPVKRNSYDQFVRWLQSYRSQNTPTYQATPRKLALPAMRTALGNPVQ